MAELEDMMETTGVKDEISDRAVLQSIEERKKREFYTQHIYLYCRKNDKRLGDIGMQEVEEMCKDLRPRDKQLFQEQFERALRTQRGKSLQWIAENNKSLYLKEKHQW